MVPRFRAVYHPERELAVDQTLVKYKSRVHFRQFIPSKLGRFAIKAFTLAESTSGYVLGSKVYTAKAAAVVQKDQREKAVMSLMEPFVVKGYYLSMDNNYISMKEMLYAVRCLKSNEDMILALAEQFNRLSYVLCT